MDDPLWFTLADEPCSGLGSETVLSEDGLCYRINLSPAEEVRPNNSPRLVLYLFHAVFFMLKLGTHGKLFSSKMGEQGLRFSEKDWYYLQAQTDMPFHYLKLVV